MGRAFFRGGVGKAFVCVTASFVAATAGFSCNSSKQGPAAGSGGSGTLLPPTHVDPSTWPASVAALAAGLDTIVKGGQADLDGDGSVDVETTLDGGTRTVNYLVAGVVQFSIVYHSADSVEMTGDTDLDGTLDYHVQALRNGDTATETMLRDRDYDGTDDTRTTRVFKGISGTDATVDFTLEQLQGDPAAFKVVSTRSGPAVEQYMDGECAGMIQRPSNFGPSVSPMNRDNIRIITNGEPGACSLSQAEQIAKAFAKALDDGLSCLALMNPRIKAQLYTALAERPLNVSCGNNCNLPNGAFSIALTDTPGSVGEFLNGHTMSLNMLHVNDSGCLQAVLLHELLHYAGEPHAGDMSGQGGTDQVYGCGRFCANCADCGIGKGDQAADCARCMDTDQAKHDICGTKTVRVQGGPDDTCGQLCQNTQCGAGFDKSAVADSCLWVKDQLCDGTPWPQGYSYDECVLSCPAGVDVTCGNGCGEMGLSEGVVTPCVKPFHCP